ncbi:MAG TPA: transporter, partial [Salinimicrobium catena]|nr:transporter [Salinimicrobium catena]
TYMNGVTTNSNSDFDLGQGGLAMVFNNTDEDSDWKKFTLAFNYSKTANFEDDYLAAGRNTRSINHYFLEYSRNVPIELLDRQGDISDLYANLGETEGFGAQQAFLGYQGFLFDYDPENTNSEYQPYVSNIAPGTFDQEYSYAATGLNGKFSFNFATQYQEFLYMGINLNTHFINYDRVIGFYENNNNAGSQINTIYFEDRLSTLGSGFSLQLGALTRIGENLRAGFAYETPSWYEISEETTQYLETDSNELGNAVVDPQVINVYPDYKLQTPAKYTGSLAYLFGDRALLSFDYSYKDHSSMKFKPKGDPDFAFQNDLMETELQGASTYRLGGEYRIEGWSLRGGYRFEESPYKNESTLEDLQGYSFGLGYNFGNIKIDAAYETFEQDRNPQLFETGLTDRAGINRQTNNVVLSISFGI